MKILNKIVDFIKSLISKVRKPVHVETPVTSEKKVEEVEKAETVEKPVEVPETSVTSEKKVEKHVETPVKQVKRRGRPRKVKSEWFVKYFRGYVICILWVVIQKILSLVKSIV